MPTWTRRQVAKFRAKSKTSTQNVASAGDGDTKPEKTACQHRVAPGVSSKPGNCPSPPSPRLSARKRPTADVASTTVASASPRKSRRSSRASAFSRQTKMLTGNTGTDRGTEVDSQMTLESNSKAVKVESEIHSFQSQAPLSRHQEPHLLETATSSDQQISNFDSEQGTSSDTSQQSSASASCEQSVVSVPCQQSTTSDSLEISTTPNAGQHSAGRVICQLSTTVDGGQQSEKAGVACQPRSSGDASQLSNTKHHVVKTVEVQNAVNELPADLQSCVSAVESETDLTTEDRRDDHPPHITSIAPVSEHWTSGSHSVALPVANSLQVPVGLPHDSMAKLLDSDPSSKLQKPSMEAQSDMYSSNCITIFVVDSNSESPQSDAQPGTWRLCVDQKGTPQALHVSALVAPGESSPVEVPQIIGANNQVHNAEQQVGGSIAEGDGATYSRQDYQHSSKATCIKNSYTMDESGLISCKHCSYTTTKMANFYKHRRLHADTVKLYECSQCGHRSTTSSNLTRHLLTHTKERKFECGECKQRFLQKIHLTRHIQYKHTAKSVSCKLCDYTCAQAEPDLRLHRKRRHQKVQESKEVFCEDCGFVAKNKRDLAQHRKFHQPGPELKLFCKQCSFVTDCQSKLRRHEMTHTCEKPFSCDYCNYCSSQKEHVLRHMQAKHKNGQDGKDKVKSRIAGHGGKNAIDETVKPSGRALLSDRLNRLKKVYKPVDFTKKDKIHACKLCTMTFSKALNLYKHMNMQHEELQRGKELNCVVCNFTASSRQNLILHLRRHTQSTKSKSIGGSCFKEMKLFHCVICNYQSHQHHQVLTHMSSAHNMQVLTKPDGQVSFVVVDTSGVGDAGEATTALVSSTSDFFEDVDAGTNEEAALQSGEEAETQVAHYSIPAESTDEEISAAQSDSETVQTTLLQDQLSQIESGDYIEINGQMYKVEVANSETDSEVTETAE